MWLSNLRTSAPARALRHRNFRLFISGNLVNLLGTRIHEIAAGWVVWTLTESGAWLGALALAEMIPRMLIWPIAGVLADRMDRRRLAFVFQSLAALSAALLGVASALDVMEVWMVVAVHGILGVCLGFWQPARLSLMSQVVPRDDMNPAVALNSVVGQASRIVGPAIAGFIIVYAGATTAFFCNAVTYLAVIVALQLMTLDSSPRARSGRQGMASETMEGVRYILRHPGIGPLILIVLVFAVSVRPVVDLFPAFADAIFGKGAGGLSALNSMIGIGALAGGVWASWRSGLRGLTVVLAVAGGVGGLATLLFALTENFAFALACTVFAGWGIVLQAIVAQTLIHSAVDDEVRGRVFSLYGVINGAAPGIGTFAMGWAGDHVGLHIPVAVGGAIGVLLCVAVMLRRGRLAATLEGAAADPPATR